MVAWGLSGGRRAWFAKFGLHKTATQLEAMRVILAQTGKPVLIVAPLGVRREFIREAAERFKGDYAIDLRFIRSSAEVDGPAVYLTNYESVRDGKLSPDPFIAVSLAEAAILRGFGGTKTFREFMAIFAGDDRRDMSNRDLDMKGRLPPTFMLLPPHSVHPDVWTDVARMRGRSTWSRSARATNSTFALFSTILSTEPSRSSACPGNGFSTRSAA